MKTFKIEFLVGNKTHSALIHRVEADPDKGQLTLYTTHEIEPALPIPMITFVGVSLERLKWEVPTEMVQIARLIGESIISKARELGIPLSDTTFETTRPEWLPSSYRQI